MGIYSISDLAELTGVKTHTLRVWEKRYGLLTPQRTDTNIRYYLDSDLKVLMLVLDLYRHGFKISRIAEMSPEEMEEESKRLTSGKEDDQGRLLQGIIHMDVTIMNDILDESIRKTGFEDTLTHLILPLLEKMEIMWLSGSIEEAHEICFRELIRRKAIREIDAIPHQCSGARVIMFLPQGNQQELSHLFMHYFLRRQGLCVTDLGTEIGLDCATSALKQCQAECIIMVNADPVHWQFGAYVHDLVNRTSLPVIITGRAVEHDWSQYDGQVIVIETIDDTIRFVSRLKENLQHLIS